MIGVLGGDIVSEKKSPFVDDSELASRNVTILKTIDDGGVEKKIWLVPVCVLSGGGHVRVTEVTTAVEPAMLVAPGTAAAELACGSVRQAAT